MGYRSFTDAKGVSWQAWDVIPRLAERRTLERRARAPQPAHSERRTQLDRRVVAGVRPVLISGLDGGWLCFEAPQEKRRLSPIPNDWLNCAIDTLESYLAGAKRTVRPVVMG